MDNQQENTIDFTGALPDSYYSRVEHEAYIGRALGDTATVISTLRSLDILRLLRLYFYAKRTPLHRTDSIEATSYISNLLRRE
jgi:hypothetical protein